jgi:Ni,Fe-hydrogenase III large subunit
MTPLAQLAANRSVLPQRPWPRVEVDSGAWVETGRLLADGELTLLGLWSETDAVHAALLDAGAGEMLVTSLDCPDGRYPSLGALHAPAIRLERAIRDIFGLEADGLGDRRPWLDHGRFDDNGDESVARARGSVPRYPFLPVEGDSLHQIPVGPVHAGIIEPGHFRFTANGETVVRLEQRLGYVHRGVEALMAGSDLDRAARLAGRISGDSTVAYAWAFARAAEAALDVEVPDRALWLRALMAETERLANHIGDIGAICNDAAFALMHAHASVLRERVLRAAGAVFGNRLMRDRIVPGGVTVDIDRQQMDDLRALATATGARLDELVDLYDNTASLQDRTVGTGFVDPRLARQFGAGGFVGRASGRAFDARRFGSFPPYDELTVEVPVRSDGDVNARVWIRILEARQSLSLIARILDGLPAGPVQTGVPRAGGVGLGLVEGFRGDILVWLRLNDDGTVSRCHPRDPSWFQWPLLEAAIDGNIVADFPLCNKSFNCSYAGHDL